MTEPEKRKWYQLDSRALSNLVVVFAGILLYLGLTHLPQVRSTVRSVLEVFTPFIAGFVIAYLLNTPVDFFEREIYKNTKGKRALSIVTVFLITVVVIAILLQLILPQVTDSIRQLLNNLTAYLSNLDSMVQDLTQRFHVEGEGLSNLVDHYNDFIRSLTSADMVKRITGFLTSSAPELWNFGMSVGNGVVNGVVTAMTAVIASIYMLSGKPRLVRQLKAGLRCLSCQGR